jgi:hypothetical protein
VVPTGAASQPPIRFRDATRDAGIRFHLGHGGRSPLNILETAGCGAAFLDYDADGWPDLFLMGQPGCALYHNERNGRFSDATVGSGLAEPGTWMGCASGDYDNDGWPDLLLTGYGKTRLFHNEGAAAPGPRFRDVTEAAGVRVPGWATSAVFFDYDRDGWLDFYVARYMRFGPADPQLCTIGPASGGGQPVLGACGPEVYEGERGLLFHNRGPAGAGSRRPLFEEVTRAAGLLRGHERGLGVAVGDYDEDGNEDLYVANDRTPGDLFRNLGGGRFVNLGVATGTAYGATGNAQGGMGVDFADYDGDGREDLFVATFYGEPKSLYHNEGGGQFREVSAMAGLAGVALPYVAFGTRFFDADNDGWLDLLIASGHVVDTQERVDPRARYREPLLLLRGGPGGRFADETARAGEALQRPVVGRGLALGDYDNDGRLDALVIDLEGAPLLLRNESGGERPGNHWTGLQLVGRQSNRQGLGARVIVEAGDRRWVRRVTTGGSYLSAGDPRVFVGLGPAAAVDRIEVRWPSGARTELRGQPAGRLLTIRE